MKIQLDQKLKDAKGRFFGEKIQCLVLNVDKELVKRSDGNYLTMSIDHEDFKRTLRNVIEESLLYENPKSPLSGKTKNERYKLWQKVSQAVEQVDLTANEITTIKECIGDIQPILITGQCEELLEGKSNGKEEEPGE